MLKARANAADGTPLVILGLSGDNLTALTAGEPARLNLADIGLPPCHVLIVYGRTELALIEELRAGGLVTAEQAADAAAAWRADADRNDAPRVVDQLRDVAHQVRQGTRSCPAGAPAHSQIIGGERGSVAGLPVRQALNIGFVTDEGRGWICARVYDEGTRLRAVRYDRDGRTVEQLAKPVADPLCVVDTASWLIQAIAHATAEERPGPVPGG